MYFGHSVCNFLRNYAQFAPLKYFVDFYRFVAKNTITIFKNKIFF